jgi:hypothetical protein
MKLLAHLLPSRPLLWLGVWGVGIGLGYAGSFSSSYVIVQDTHDAGGGRAVSANYIADDSLGGFGGISAAPVAAVAARIGYCGQLNDPPIAPPHTLERPAGKSSKILAAQLLGNSTDLENDPITFISVSATSEQGAALALDGPWVLYMPPAGFDGVDAFAYVVSDSCGGAAIGTVTVLVQGNNDITRNILSIELVPGQPDIRIRIRFVGIPGRTYQVQATTDLGNPNWRALGNGQADSSGLYEFIDADAASYPVRFYRALNL